MPKILARAGVSLSDVYDVQGSIAGIEQLESEEVRLVHEMGSTIFSERLGGQILVASTGDIAQNLSFSANFSAPADLNETTALILNIMVSVDTTSRLLRCAVVLREGLSAQETPIWVWDGTNEVTIRMSVGGATANIIALQELPGWSRLPNLILSADVLLGDWAIFLRGTTSGFGAGTVDTSMHAYLSFPGTRAGLSSKGLPLPSW